MSAATDFRRVRHDVGSSLAVIAGFARLLEAETAPTDEQRREYARRIDHAATDLRRILDDALGRPG